MRDTLRALTGTLGPHMRAIFLYSVALNLLVIAPSIHSSGVRFSSSSGVLGLLAVGRLLALEEAHGGARGGRKALGDEHGALLALVSETERARGFEATSAEREACSGTRTEQTRSQ